MGHLWDKIKKYCNLTTKKAIFGLKKRSKKANYKKNNFF